MPVRLNAASNDFETRFLALLAAKREVSADVDAVVRGIIGRVRETGDAALIELTRKFDGLELTAETLKIGSDEIEAAYRATEPATLDALELAHRRITSHHERQRPKDDRYTDAIGVELGSRWTAVESVGLYVPGGAASYPSSVLMNAIPAKVAGVSRIAMVVPARGGVLNPLVLAAARIAGIDEIYRIGGAQAVAALAYGTATIAPVAKIVGPGNAYVAAAKRQVFGTVGIDMIAGPSEVLVIADGANDPDWIAADLLAQAEHDTAAQSILITDDAGFADAVAGAVERQLKRLSRQETAAASWRDFGAIIVVGDLGAAPALADRIAAEHLELAVDDPEALFAEIRNAGAVFLGRHTPEVIGDYVGGSNHVLPTARSARFSSGLSVLDFVKRTSTLKLGPEQLRALGPAAIELARVEGLDAHWPLRRHPAEPLSAAMAKDTSRLIDVALDETIGRATPDIEHERAVAIFDLIEENFFRPAGTVEGPYRLKLSLIEKRLVFDIRSEADVAVVTHILSLTPLKRIIRDYFLICDSYYEAIRSATPSQIEAIDMGRRGIHNDGSETLRERLAGKIEVDLDTARRLFTLICVLHWRN